MQLYVYGLSFPIDDFGLMLPFKEFYNMLDEDEADENSFYSFNKREMKYLLLIYLRELAACAKYWEGDVRGNNLYIGSIIHEDMGNHLVIALKQDNNGSSYVISAFPLLHLSENELARRPYKPVEQKIQDGIKKIVYDFTGE